MHVPNVTAIFLNAVVEIFLLYPHLDVKNTLESFATALDSKIPYKSALCSKAKALDSKIPYHC